MAPILVITAVVQWPAAVILLVASLLIPLNMRLAGLFAKEGADARMAASARLAAVVLDSFRGMPTLRNIGALARRRAELARAAADLNATTIAVVRRASLSGAVMDVVITFSIAANATYVGLSLLGYLRLGAAPGMTLFRGLLVLLICPMYFQPHARPGRRATTARNGHCRRYRRSAACSHESPSRRRPIAHRCRAAGRGCPRQRRVQLSGADEPTLHGVDLTVGAGAWTAVTGPSGAGKTTLLSLIAGVRVPTAGAVRWRDRRRHVRTAARRLCLDRSADGSPPGIDRRQHPDRTTGRRRADVEQAVAAAGLAEVVARLPRGLDTPLGEDGSGLSTGEARRVAIARAFLTDAGLWVLDEPTAHLDADTEAQIIAALRTATRGRTVIVATHSPAVARSADQVVAVADGTVQPPVTRGRGVKASTLAAAGLVLAVLAEACSVGLARALRMVHRRFSGGRRQRLQRVLLPRPPAVACARSRWAGSRPATPTGSSCMRRRCAGSAPPGSAVYDRAARSEAPAGPGSPWTGSWPTQTPPAWH